MHRQKFYVEKTLGKLAEKLRMMGFFAAWPVPPETFFTARENTAGPGYYLSRTTAVAKQYQGHRSLVFMVADKPEDQVRQVIRQTGITRDTVRLFHRCIPCNGEITGVSRELAAARIPAYVAATCQRFFQCADCGRIYWEGTHAHRARDHVAKWFL